MIYFTLIELMIFIRKLWKKVYLLNNLVNNL